MTAFLGFDTSNYTTSAALFFPETGEIRQEKKWKLLKDEQGNELLDAKGNKQWTRLDEYEDILGEWVVLQK